MNKFEFTLTQGSEFIVSERTKIASAEGKAESEDIVRELEAEVRGIESRLLNETDIYPDSKMSQAAVKAGFSAKAMFRNIQRLKVELEIKNRELSIAKGTHKEYFLDEIEAPKKGKKVAEKTEE